MGTACFSVCCHVHPANARGGQTSRGTRRQTVQAAAVRICGQTRSAPGSNRAAMHAAACMQRCRSSVQLTCRSCVGLPSAAQVMAGVVEGSATLGQNRAQLAMFSRAPARTAERAAQGRQRGSQAAAKACSPAATVCAGVRPATHCHTPGRAAAACTANACRTWHPDRVVRAGEVVLQHPAGRLHQRQLQLPDHGTPEHVRVGARHTLQQRPVACGIAGAQRLPLQVTLLDGRGRIAAAAAAQRRLRARGWLCRLAAAHSPGRRP